MKVFLLVLVLIGGALGQCTPSVTRVTGNQAPAQVCSGEIVFEDNFNTLDRNRWFFENTMAGGGNWEFQWYPSYDPTNCFVRNGNLHLAPTFTSDIFGEDFLTSGRVVIPPAQCTQSDWYGCDRQGTPDNIINPIRSTRVDTRQSFGFVYGELEIRARAPAGDWLWPALWLMPFNSTYGGWPRSGEIDLMEQRGNRNLFNGNVNVGVEQTGSTMHFGPQWDVNGWPTAHHTLNTAPGVGYNAAFHVYRLRWTEESIQFFTDNTLMGTVDAGEGFWYRDPRFAQSGMANPWVDGSRMAPFDQPFYIIMNLAIGGVNYFPDHFVNSPHPKPWWNGSPRAAADFWEGRWQWGPTWIGEEPHMEIDYVRVRAL